MQKIGQSVFRPEARYNKYNMINVWASNEQREAMIKRKLLTDKDFKMTSLQTNPLYKPIFDKLDA